MLLKGHILIYDFTGSVAGKMQQKGPGLKDCSPGKVDTGTLVGQDSLLSDSEGEKFWSGFLLNHSVSLDESAFLRERQV